MANSAYGLDFSTTENQRMIAEMVQTFAARHIKPQMMEWDESQEFPVHVFKNWAKWD